MTIQKEIVEPCPTMTIRKRHTMLGSLRKANAFWKVAVLPTRQRLRASISECSQAQGSEHHRLEACGPRASFGLAVISVMPFCGRFVRI